MLIIFRFGRPFTLTFFFGNLKYSRYPLQDGVSKSVRVFVGMTKEKIGIQEIRSKYFDDKKVAFVVEQIFLHPKFQTSQVCSVVGC